MAKKSGERGWGGKGAGSKRMRYGARKTAHKSAIKNVWLIQTAGFISRGME
jgi:hypothetical protein